MSAHPAKAISKTVPKTTQAKILKNAEHLIWQQGFEATSLNDVVSKSGLSKGAFFHYYPNKQAISQHVIDKYVHEQLRDPLVRHLSAANSVKNGLFNWVAEFYQNFKANDFKGGCLLGNMALELSDQNDAAREQIKGHFIELENLLVSHLKPLAEDGKLLIEPRQFARLFIAALQGLIMMSKVHKDNIRASREFQALAELIEYMIKD